MTTEQLFQLSQYYLDLIETQGDEALNDEQHTLLAYCYLDSQIQEGGFIQLIASGYGEYIFQNPVANSLRRWKIKATPKILEQAAKLYAQIGNEIEIAATLNDDIATLRTQFPQFEELDGDYYDVADDDLILIAEYVSANWEKFTAKLPENAINQLLNNTN